jgi:hypothetical protein
MKRSALPKLNAEDVRAALGGTGPRPEKLDRINFLVAPTEKREIQETAKAHGLTVTDYLLRLHRQTRVLVSPGKSGNRVRR